MHEILLFYKIKCKKSCFLLPQESGFRMLWKPFIIKMCSCRRREVMCLLSWEQDCVRGNRCQASCIQTLCLSSGLCLLSDTEKRLHVCDQENANAELHSYCKFGHRVLLAGIHQGNSYSQVLLLGDYHSTFSCCCCCCCLKSDKPSYISIPNGQQAATKVSISFSLGNTNFKSISIEPFHTAEEANA